MRIIGTEAQPWFC